MITCRLENGHEDSFRHVTADGVVLDDSNRVLLVRRAPHLTNGDLWALVGGFLDRDETLVEGIAREVLEESGYECTRTELFAVTSNPNRRGEDRQNVTFVFLVEPGERVGEPDAESTDCRWFDLDDLPDKSTWAFDHFETIQLVRAHLLAPMRLPVLR